MWCEQWAGSDDCEMARCYYLKGKTQDYCQFTADRKRFLCVFKGYKSRTRHLWESSRYGQRIFWQTRVGRAKHNKGVVRDHGQPLGKRWFYELSNFLSFYILR